MVQMVHQSYMSMTSLNHCNCFFFVALTFSLGLILGLSYDLRAIPFSTFSSPLGLPLPPPVNQPVVVVEVVEERPLMHGMSDVELVARASRVGVSGNSKNAPKVAFMFMVKGPLPLAPLWEKFFEGHKGYFSIYLHSHPSYTKPFPKDSVFFGRNIPSQEVMWGTMSMVDAEKRLLANALLDPSNQRFVLLSESCIPLFNFTTIYDYLINSKLSFLGCFDDAGRDGRGRYNKTMSPKITLSQWRKGPQWFEAHKELALGIIREHEYYDIFKQHCHKPCFNDEHYLPTIANIAYPHMISGRSLTWVDWSKRGPHPSTYRPTDINEELLNRIRFGSNCTYNGVVTNICFLFARKFLPSTLEPLLGLAPVVFRFGA